MISSMKKYTLAILAITLIATMSVFPHGKVAASGLPSSVVIATTAHVSVSGLATKAKTSWPWYVTRASGMVAAVLLLLLIISGIGQVTGLTYRLVEPLAAWSLHRALAISLGVSILMHGTTLLFDKYVPFSILQVLVPFTSHYTPATIAGMHLGSLYVAFGLLAAYAAAIVIISSLLWMDKRPRTWRALHYTGYLLVLLVFLHGLYLGTDLKHGLPRLLWYGFGVIILIGIASRLRRAHTIKEEEDEA
jgi:sulfoxide reductase heme-binding subunit YedZ